MTDNAIITAAQNIAVAINNLTKTTNNAHGTANSATYDDSSAVVITTGNGRLNNVTIVIDAAVNVDVYDSATTTAVSASNLLVSIDASTKITTLVNKVYSNGLVLDVGAGAQANITYSPF